jgi:hypothetical protein
VKSRDASDQRRGRASAAGSSAQAAGDRDEQLLVGERLAYHAAGEPVHAFGLDDGLRKAGRD